VKKLAQGFNTAAHDSNPGSLSREFEALPLTPRATVPYKGGGGGVFRLMKTYSSVFKLGSVLKFPHRKYGVTDLSTGSVSPLLTIHRRIIRQPRPDIGTTRT